jgi:cytochrome c biogenesis protein CcmG, thiol:disulfide interchange protein DsbE
MRFFPTLNQRLTLGRKIGIGVGVGCLVALAVISAIGPGQGPTQDEAATTGTTSAPAPAQSLTLPVLGRKDAAVSLGQYRGRGLLVNFFASWCPPCKAETPLLARFYRAHRGQVAIIGVDVSDGTAAALRFVRSAGVAYPVGVDPTGRAATRWGVVAIPQTFFLNPAHYVVKRVFGAVTLAELDAGLARMRGAGPARTHGAEPARTH